MGFWWFKTTQQRLSHIQKESFIKNLQFPKTEFPKIEFPQIPQIPQEKIQEKEI